MWVVNFLSSLAIDRYGKKLMATLSECKGQQ